MRPLIVVNPSAGAGAAGRSFGEMRPIVERSLGPVDVAFTAGPGHAVRIAGDAARAGRSLLVAVVGDGTVHEVANGILDSGERGTALGVIGQGTGGDFRRSLGLEHRLDRYLAAIVSGRERPIDAARATFRDEGGGQDSRWFVNVLSAGLGGRVDRHVRGMTRALGSTAAYALASARALAGTDPAPIACTLHRGAAREGLRTRAYVVAVCNGGYFGAGMRVAPSARVDDGRLEVVVLAAPGRLAFLALASKLYRGGHLAAAGVTARSCDAVDLDAPTAPAAEPVALDIDGEPLGVLPARITLARGALRVRA